MRLNQVEKNPGLRFDAKLKLNSLWGKFIQQAVMESIQFVTKLRQFREMMLNPTIKESSLQFMFTTEETLLASYLHAEDYVEHARRFNPYLGALSRLMVDEDYMKRCLKSELIAFSIATRIL